MKSKVIRINYIIWISITLFLIFIIGTYKITIDQTEKVDSKTHDTVRKIKIENKEETDDGKVEKIIIENQSANALVPYQNMEREYKGYTVIGKIKIPKLEIEKYIIEETNEEALKVAVTKICGPNTNEIGNLCIAGHNYTQTFGRLKELEIGDEISIIDIYDREIIYKIYEISKVNPTDTTCLNQNTKGEREITLVTCTLGAIKRNIIKAVEMYD